MNVQGLKSGTGVISTTCLITAIITSLALAAMTKPPPAGVAVISTMPHLERKQLDNSGLLETALETSATNLAQGYRWVQQTLEWLPMVEAGMTIQTSDMVITPDNVDSVKAELLSRLSIYEAAIDTRGYEAIAGPYQGEATEACKRTQVLWTTSIANGEAGQISIRQDGFEIQIVHTFEDGDESLSAEIPGVIVESAVVFADPMNTDFILVGTVMAEQITVRPDVENNLSAWPDWANPPARADLEACVVTLKR